MAGGLEGAVGRRWRGGLGSFFCGVFVVVDCEGVDSAEGGRGSMICAVGLNWRAWVWRERKGRGFGFAMRSSARERSRGRLIVNGRQSITRSVN